MFSAFLAGAWKYKTQHNKLPKPQGKFCTTYLENLANLKVVSLLKAILGAYK